MPCPDCKRTKRQHQKALDKYHRALTYLLTDITKAMDKFNERVEKIEGFK